MHVNLLFKKIAALIPCLLLTVALNAQTVTKAFRSVPLKTVLEEVERQTGYSILFENEDVDVSRPVTATFKDATLQTVLDTVLDKSLRYTVKGGGKLVTISRRSPVSAPTAPNGEMTVAGTVISSADNQPIVGANIYVEGTNVGTTTDAGGNYKLTVPASAKTVTVSFLGYDTKKISVRDIHLFKLITLASALDSGAVTLNDSFYCGGQEKFSGREQILNCWKSAGHGAQSTAQALGNSCNIAFGHIGLRMGGDMFYDYLKSFGIMEKTGVDLPGEASGLFYERKYLNNPAQYGTSYLITSSFGQSFRITPMQLVRSVAAIVNGGYLLEPHVVSTVLDADGNVVQKNERTVLRQVISEETSATMREFMEFVVTDGTASNAYTPGYRVGGKTGTSEKIDEYDENGKPVDDKIVSFIGVAPINDPQYVVLVALDTPEYVAGTSYTPHNQYISGGLMGAPTVRDIFSDILPYLGVEPDYSSDDIRGVNITLPDVIGKTESEASELLSAKSITYRTVGNGSVVTDQLPSAGQEVPGHSEIVLYMGEEKVTEKTTVPNFIGYGVADVNWLANQYGLYIQAKGTDRTDVYVSAAYQDIPEGTEVDKGTTITVEFTTGGASD